MKGFGKDRFGVKRTTNEANEQGVDLSSLQHKFITFPIGEASKRASMSHLMSLNVCTKTQTFQLNVTASVGRYAYLTLRLYVVDWFDLL